MTHSHQFIIATSVLLLLLYITCVTSKVGVSLPQGMKKVENGGAYGIDISLQTCQAGVSPDTWKCLVNQGFSFAIIEVWNGGYQFNNAISKCVGDAWNAGMAHVDVYAFMCPNCRGNNPGSEAVDRIVQGLQGITYGQLWFDIEQCDGCWNDLNSNAQYVKSVVDRARSQLGSNKLGMYSSVYEWQITMGKNNSFSDLPLWYAHYDGNPSFSDAWAYSFGGWSHPNIKQYNDRGSGCGIDADVNWYPL